MDIKIGNKEYDVWVAETQKQKQIGLQNITELPEDGGMLFDFTNESGQISMWMKDTKIPLDIIFIDDSQEVISVHQGTPESEQLITEDNVSYVLEVNVNSGIKKGDELDLDDDDDYPVMKVLAQDGSSQMDLYGGERIFRRAFTKQIIQWAKKAQEASTEDEYKRICIKLGKKMFKEIDAQDNRPPEYVQSPKESKTQKDNE